MSKQRPSRIVAAKPKALPAVEGEPLADWLKRVFRGSFTRGGKLRRTRQWSVKLQANGMRRTFPLNTLTRPEAARRAMVLHDVLHRHGWEAALEQAEGFRGKSGQQDSPLADVQGATAVSSASWKGRLIHRKYLDWIRPDTNREFAARIDYKGAYSYFPLGTEHEDQAAEQARLRFRDVKTHGWRHVSAVYPREFTMSIFWLSNPVVCTYATMLTMPEGLGSPPTSALVPRANARSVALVESEASVASALRHWLDRQQGFQCHIVYADCRSLLDQVVRDRPDLLLINRSLPEFSSTEFQAQLRTKVGQLPVFGYGIYEDSDQIFIRLTGVEAGYLFRRRAPLQLMEPLFEVWGRQLFTQRTVTERVRSYFQGVLGVLCAPEQQLEQAGLTTREQEVLSLLSKGHVDKEIAEILRISAWTVHNHLRHIYDKLQVRTRTEAVVKYLHK